MTIYKYMRINIRDISNMIIKQYNLLVLSKNYDFVLFKLCKGNVYGLPQDDTLSQKHLVQNLHL